ncbi:MAG: hypothetical protein WA785_14325, partial [Candidatus Acidiferrales bacterium]
SESDAGKNESDGRQFIGLGIEAFHQAIRDFLGLVLGSGDELGRNPAKTPLDPSTDAVSNAAN